MLILVSLAGFSFLAAACSFAETVWIDGKLPEDSYSEGEWVWDEQLTQGETVSHTSNTTSGRDRRQFRTESKVSVGSETEIIQYIYLDPANLPSGIMAKFIYDNDDELSLYWESDREAFVDMSEYITAWYMGPLPEAGKWVRLDIKYGEFDLSDANIIDGMAFIVSDGKAWWGKTIIKKKGEEYAEEKTQGQTKVAQQESK